MNLHDPNENRAVTVLEKVAHFVPDALLRVRLKRFVSASRDLTHPLPEPHHLVGVNSIEVHGEHAFTSHTSWSSGHDLMTPNAAAMSDPRPQPLARSSPLPRGPGVPRKSGHRDTSHARLGRGGPWASERYGSGGPSRRSSRRTPSISWLKRESR